jgi:hypothetical protein
MGVCPRDVIVEYAKLNSDRAVRMMSTWEKFPVELFKLVSVQRSRRDVTSVRAILQTMGRLRNQPANWEDPFEGKIPRSSPPPTRSSNFFVRETKIYYIILQPSTGGKG